MKLSGGGWVLCWWGRLDPESDDWFEQCYYFPADLPGYLQFPWCSGSSYEELYLADTITIEGDPCDCMSVEGEQMVWRGEGGPWGEWFGKLGDCEGEAVFGIIRPTGVSVAGVAEWYWELNWRGFILSGTYHWGCGQFPGTVTADHWEEGPCRDSRVVWSFYEPE